MTVTKPRACVLRADGTNCDEETAFAFEKAGGLPEAVHINQLRQHDRSLRDYQILCIPGGFSYGDDVASGKILAVELITFLGDALREFVEKGGLILGICNGFQVLVRTGLLPFQSVGEMTTTLTANDSGKFECRWVELVIDPSMCVFTRNLEHTKMRLMVANGEGNFKCDSDVLSRMARDRQIVLRYVDPRDNLFTEQYPENPSGSLLGIAGVCDPTGRIFGLMPHPERFVLPTQNPNWRRFPTAPQGLPIFENAVNFVKQS